ncbi:tRNA (cytosine(34)-C(5))-methyltransferase, mitochondrial isoform X2 [Bombina bombina]|uniref:tRNA (cytosine(34)-C(5))-methyltransferase, mitochondrial isoform X2 n=1 Tax=Bombina bombina TaxID=8345 RepID=UPI00235AE9EB|nr:tRNA (cytosine(34)-C(5))-methyltransferase, mitochondrial isoform X2 [Bombina bombina]
MPINLQHVYSESVVKRILHMGRLQKQLCQFVLEHFEKTYSKDLGDSWNKAREVLTHPGSWQYAVLLNNFTSPLEVEKNLQNKGYHLLFHETISDCPSTLKCYIKRKPGKFPSQRHQDDKLKDYYMLNASSLLPVLALQVKDGESVLDMCAAPGGKSIALLQCASPGHLHCNEPDIHRSRWLKQTLASFVPTTQIHSISTSELDGRLIGKFYSKSYDKVLVDAPCSNDRSWLFTSDSKQSTARISQRKMLPLLQIELLRYYGLQLKRCALEDHWCILHALFQRQKIVT